METRKLLAANAERAYLLRLGFDERPPADAASLATLHRAHLASVPFENLDLHLGRRIALDTSRFVTKIVEEHRGGFCYELNGAFASLLRTLGFRVDLLEARVHGADGPTQPFDHMCLRVFAPRPFLADVGFGACFDEPIPFEPSGVVHHDSAGEFRLERFDEEWFDLIDESGPQYRFRALACELDDFEPGCTFHQTPQSHFMRNTVCSRRTEAGRVTIRGRVLITTTGNDRVETEIDDDRLGDVYREHFGITLSAEALARLPTAPHSR